MNEVITPMPLTEMALKPQEVLRAAALIQEVMAAVMKDGEHYGVVPGTSGKKSLFKSGAEKLCFTFGLSNKLDIKADQLPGGHREYTITCNLFDRGGNLRGQGVGSASTMESKHRYRGAGGKPCPSCGALSARASKKEYGGGYYCDQKAGGCGTWKTKAGTPECKTLDALANTKTENTDPADQYNTVLKMAKKRALVDAVLTATAASDCFAQDLEDLEHEIVDADARDAAKPAAPQAARTAPATTTAPTETKPAEQKQEKPPEIHPSMAAANSLYANLQQVEKGLGKEVLELLAKINGAATPREIKPENLVQFGKDVAGVVALGNNPAAIRAALAEWAQTVNGGKP